MPEREYDRDDRGRFGQGSGGGATPKAPKGPRNPGDQHRIDVGGKAAEQALDASAKANELGKRADSEGTKGAHRAAAAAYREASAASLKAGEAFGKVPGERAAEYASEAYGVAQIQENAALDHDDRSYDAPEEAPKVSASPRTYDAPERTNVAAAKADARGAQEKADAARIERNAKVKAEDTELAEMRHAANAAGQKAARVMQDGGDSVALWRESAQLRREVAAKEAAKTNPFDPVSRLEHTGFEADRRMAVKAAEKLAAGDEAMAERQAGPNAWRPAKAAAPAAAPEAAAKTWAKVAAKREPRSVTDTKVAGVTDWIKKNASDRDEDPSAGFARASTDEVAEAMGVTPAEAYKTLSTAAKRGLVTKSNMKVSLGRQGRRGLNKEKAVGWQTWEVSLAKKG